VVIEAADNRYSHEEGEEKLEEKFQISIPYCEKLLCPTDSLFT
jgi:hypothetical protein